MAAFEPRDSDVSIPPPPRFVGDWKMDAVALREWQASFYTALVLVSGLLDPTYQASGGEEIDPDNLPDPTQTTIARAQATANLAVEMVQQRFPARGTITIEDAEDTATVLFDEAMPSDDYLVLTSIDTYTGAPDPDAFRLIKVTRASDGFAVELQAAPGAGKSVTYAYLIIGEF